MLKEQERADIVQLVEKIKNARHPWRRNIQIIIDATDECDDAITGRSHISDVSIDLYDAGAGDVRDFDGIPSIKIVRNGIDGIETYNEVLCLLANSGLKQTDHDPLEDIEMTGWLTGYDRFILPKKDWPKKGSGGQITCKNA